MINFFFKNLGKFTYGWTKRSLFFILIFSLSLQTSLAGPLKVITTTAVLKDLVENIGGEQVEIVHLQKPFTDPHLFTVKPGDLSKLRWAELFVKVGGDEEEWTFNAVNNSGNFKLVVIDTSTGIEPLDVPTDEELKQAPGGVHLHKSGNPYYWMNPDNINLILENILEGLVHLRPDQVEFFLKRRDQYLQKLNAKINEWDQLIAPVESQPIVTYHQSWSYFAKKFNLNIIAQVEPQPGIAPSTKYLNQLFQTMNDQSVKIIMVEPFYADKKVLKLFKDQTKAQVLILPMSVGKEYKVPTYLSLIENNVHQLVRVGTGE